MGKIDLEEYFHGRKSSKVLLQKGKGGRLQLCSYCRKKIPMNVNRIRHSRAMGTISLSHTVCPHCIIEAAKIILTSPEDTKFIKEGELILATIGKLGQEISEEIFEMRDGKR